MESDCLQTGSVDRLNHGPRLSHLPLSRVQNPAWTIEPKMPSEKKPRAKERIEELDAKLDTIIKRLDTIETALASSNQASELSPILANLRSGVTLYSEPLKAMKRLYEAGRYFKTEAVEKDEISRLIIEALAVRGQMNISQVEREVRGSRGKASRRVIRERLKKLVDQNIVSVTGTGKTRKYHLVE